MGVKTQKKLDCLHGWSRRLCSKETHEMTVVLQVKILKRRSDNLISRKIEGTWQAIKSSLSSW